MTQAALKRALKDAVIEAFQERRDLLTDAMVEAIEEVALAQAIREGQRSKPVARQRVMSALRGQRR